MDKESHKKAMADALDHLEKTGVEHLALAELTAMIETTGRYAEWAPLPQWLKMILKAGADIIKTQIVADNMRAGKSN